MNKIFIKNTRTNRGVYVELQYSAPYRNQPVVAVPVKGSGTGQEKVSGDT